MSTIKYRSLHGYKYELAEEYVYIVNIPLCFQPSKRIEHALFSMSPSGILTIRRGYAWDGPSGPAIDTDNFMRASLVHDVFYQAMRMGLLDPAIWRPIADKTLHDICIEDGMSRLRAWWVYLAVRTFARRCAVATGKAEASDVILEAPKSTTG